MAGATPTATAATSASAFDQSIGVNVHMGYDWTLYNNVPLVASDLAYLGTDKVRDELLDWSNVQANYQQLAADGIKYDFLLPTYDGSRNTVNVPEFVGMVDAFAAANPGSVTAIEGPNEVNIWSVYYNGGTTLADQALIQRALYAAVRADPSLSDIPVYNLTMAYTDATQDAKLGNLSSYANDANSHAYLNDSQTPQYSMGVILPYAQIDAPGLPTVITETGYETNAEDTYSGVDQIAQAKLTLDELMDAFSSGVSQTYLYELFDEGGQSFGLFNPQGAPKLAATAIHDLTTILNDPGSGSSFTPGSLSYAVPNLPSNASQFLLEKSNGTFDVVLWAEAQVWNSNTGSEIAAPSEATSVEFGQSQPLVLVFDPLLGATPIAAYQNVQSVQVTLSDAPLVLEIPGANPTLAAPSITGFTRTGGATDGITLTGTAVAAASVLVFDNGTEIGTAVADTNGAWSFATGTLSAGNNQFTGVAVDASADVSGISAAYNVAVTAAASAATVAAPIIYDYSLTSTNQVILTGTAEANATVRIFSGTTLLGTTGVSASGAWTYTTPSFTDGDYTFTVSTTDAAGNISAASNAVDAVAVQPPAATSVTMSGAGITNGSGNARTGSVVTVTLTAGEALTVTGGTPTLTLSDGETATYTSGSGTNALNFSYTVAAGDASTDLSVTAINFNGADIEDASGNTLVGGLPEPGGVLEINAPSSAPTVTALTTSGTGISSGSGDLKAGSVVTLTLTMSEAVTVAGGRPTLTLNDGGTATYTGGSGTAALTFSYTVAAGQNTSDLAVTGVSLNGATIKDTAGNSASFSGTLTPAGTLQIDTIAPTVTSVTASGTGITNGNGDIDPGDVVTLTLSMSEAVLVSGGTPTLTLNDGGTATYTGGSGSKALTFSYTVATGQSTADLAVTAINLNTAAIADAAGNIANLAGAAANLPGTLQIDAPPPSPAVAYESVAGDRIILFGTGPAGDTISIYTGANLAGTTIADAAGDWAYETPSEQSGAYSVTATATDAAGKVSAPSSPIDPAVGSSTVGATAPPPLDTTAVMIMNNPGNGDYEIYDFGGNSVLAAYSLGAIEAPWTFSGLGTFQSGDTSDMLLRNSSTGAFEAYYVSNNSVTDAASVGAVGTNWNFAGTGDIDGMSSLSELLLRNSSSGSFELYQVAGGGVLSGSAVGAVGNNFSVKGLGNFSESSTTQMMMQGTSGSSLGQLELYTYQPSTASFAGIDVGKVGGNVTIVGMGDLLGNGSTQIVMQQNNGNIWLYTYNASANALSGELVGAVGGNFHVVGFGQFGQAGQDEMLMQNAAGDFEVYQYNASEKAFVGTAMGAVGAPWTVAGVVADQPAGASTAQLIQAMASVGGGSSVNTAVNSAISTGTTMPTLLTTAQHA